MFSWFIKLITSIFGKGKKVEVPQVIHFEPRDPLEIPGQPDCLDVGAYAIHVLKDMGINPFSDANADAMVELGFRLADMTKIFIGQPISERTKHEVKDVIQHTIHHMNAAGAFSRY